MKKMETALIHNIALFVFAIMQQVLDIRNVPCSRPYS